MKKVAVSALMIILIISVMTGCQGFTGGGQVLDPSVKLNDELAPPDSGTPDDFTPEQNLAYACYKFNRLSTWETTYSAEVTAAGTTQKVANVRKYDGEVLFSQAISYSSIKSVSEQKYFKGDDILFRPALKTKSDMTVSWSSDIAALTEEDYYGDYGLIPNEIFKFIINQDTIISSEKLEASEGNYAFGFELTVESAEYYKNEVRTMAGASGNPTYIAIKITIEMDKSWNVIRTTAYEKYKVAIMGGITCESNYEENFTLGGEVVIAEKPLFESFVPSDSGTPIEKPKQPIDYLTLAFGNLIADDLISLKANIGSLAVVAKINSQTGLFEIKIGDTVIKNIGDYVYILGEQKVKVKSLSLYRTVLNVVNQLPKIDLSGFKLPLDTPEINSLIAEVLDMLGVNKPESSDEETEQPPSSPAPSMIGRITEGIELVNETENSAQIGIDFSLDGIQFDVLIDVKDEKLASLDASISYDGKSIDIGLAPTEEQIQANTGGAYDISRLAEAVGNTIKSGIMSFKGENMLITADFDGKVYFDSPSVSFAYAENQVKLNYNDKYISVRPDVLELNMPELKIAQILQAISSLKSIPVSSVVTAGENSLEFTLDIDGIDIDVVLCENDGKLALNIDFLGKTFALTDEVASIDENADYVNADGLIRLINDIVDKGGVDLSVSVASQAFAPVINLTVDFDDKCLITDINGTVLQVSDAAYIINDKIRGVLSLDALSSVLPKIELPAIDSQFIKELLTVGNPTLSSAIDTIKSIIDGAEIYNEGDDLVIEYSGNIVGAPLELKAVIGNEIKFDGEATISGKAVTFQGESGKRLSPVSTENCINIDPIAYTVKEMLVDMPVFDLSMGDEEKGITALFMPDLEGKGFIASLSETNVYAYDKVYLANKTGMYSLTYRTAIDVLKELDIDLEDIWQIIELIKKLSVNFDYSLSVQGSKFVASFIALGITADIKFDYATNYFDGAEIYGKGFRATLSVSDAEPLKKPDSFEAKEIDFVGGLVAPVKQLLSQKQFTFSLDNLNIKSSDMTVNGFASLDQNDGLGLAADISLTKAGDTHNIKVSFADNGNEDAGDDDIKAYYTYKDKTMAVALTKESILDMLFKVTDIIGLKLDVLEKFRPASSVEMKSEIIYNALPQSLKDSLSGIIDLAEKGVDIANLNLSGILKYLDNLSIDGADGNLLLTLGGESPTSLSLEYGSALDSVTVDSAAFAGTIRLSNKFNGIGNVTSNNVMNIDSFDELLGCIINTVNLGEYHVTGSIHLNLSKLSSNLGELIDITFTLKAEILDNNKPFVYLKLEIPHKPLIAALALHRATSYIFFYDGIMYFKSERYNAFNSYTSTVYMKRTPQEFLDNIMNDLFFLVPLESWVQNLITDQVNQGVSGESSYAESIKDYKHDAGNYDIVLSLQALTGKSALGDLSLNLHTVKDERDARKTRVDSFNLIIDIANALTITFDASLRDYDPKIEFGEHEDNVQANITDMAPQITNMKTHIKEWQ